MSKAIAKFLRMADLFGIPFLQQINQKQTLFQSAIGGLLSIIIFSASLAYTIFVVYQWQTNQLSPKISNSVYISDFSLLDFNYDVLKIYFWKYNSAFMDPISEKVLLPILQYTDNNGQVVNKKIKYEISLDGQQFIIPKINFGTEEINGNLATFSSMYVLVVKCSSELIAENEQCASEEKMKQFFQQPLNVFAIQVNFKQVNSKNGQIETSMQEFYFQIEETNCYSINFFLQSNRYDIRNYFLFGPNEYKEFLSSAVIQTQSNSFSYCKNGYGLEVYGLLYLAMQASQIKTVYEYPHAGDLLANIGSIVSVLFMIKYIIIIMNQYFLNISVLHELIKMYYPQFKDIEIQKNWKRQITKVTYKQEEIDIKEFNKSYFQIVDQMKSKLSFLNLIYEISRIYLVLRSTKTREEFRRSHQIGVIFPFLQPKDLQPDSVLKSCPSIRIVNDANLLNDEDINILTQKQSVEQFITEKNCEEVQSLNEFYDINKVL